MSGTDWLVVVAGLAAIGWVTWYFFFASRHVGAPVVAPPAGVAEVHIAVRGGYDPATVRVKAGAPVRLVFERQETSGCSEEVVFPAFGIRKFLPTGQPTSIEITPPTPGRYDFMCGMSMLRGAVVAEA
ncbi:MAG: cupredoxin domain-containing protein [Gemmatimonadaceae bacterium]